MTKRTFLLAPVTAILAAVAISMPAGAAPEATGSGAAGLTESALMTVIGTVGDDTFATTDLGSLLDPVSATPTQRYGPYASGSPDSGTCANNWADDTFNRVFTIHTSNTGQITVVEQFKDGSFVTTTPPSPGACEPYTKHGTVIQPGITGSMHAYFIVSNVGPQTSTSPYCDAVKMTNTGCTTATFINTHFAPCYPAACTVTTYYAHYTAPNYQDLLYNEWKNASLDRGGDSGDIANS